MEQGTMEKGSPDMSAAMGITRRASDTTGLVSISPPLRVGEKFNDAKRSSSVFVPTSYGLSFSEHLGSVGCRSFLYRTQYLPPMRRLWESGTIGDIKQVYLSQAAFISPRGNRTAHPVTQSNSGGVDAGLALPLGSYPHFDVSKWKRSSDRGLLCSRTEQRARREAGKRDRFPFVPF